MRDRRQRPTRRKDALVYDEAHRPVEAIELYERVVQESWADLDSYLNLMAIYMDCNDGGFVAFHRIPHEITEKSLGRAHELLSEAQARFGPHPEN